MSAFTLSRRAMLLGSGASLLLARKALAAEEDLATYAAKVEDLRSIRDIKNLQARWGRWTTSGAWEGASRFFEEDGSIEWNGIAVRGHAAIEAHLRETQGNGENGIPDGRLNLRLFISPVITLSPDGQSAIGRWHEITMAAERAVSADWAGGTWVIEYRKQPKGWLIHHMRYYAQFAGPYETGWRHDAETLVRAPYHYTPDQVGVLLPDRRAAVTRSRHELDSEASLMLAESHALNVVHAFGYYLDRGMYDDIADLFIADTAIDGGATIYADGEGVWRGKRGVRRYLERYGPAGLADGELNDRLQLMPEVSHSGAMFVHNIEIGMTGQHGGTGYWSAALQGFDFIRDTKGRWRIATLRRIPVMRAEYKAGWAHPLAPEMPAGAGGEPNESFAPQPASSPYLPAPLLMHYPIAVGEIPRISNALAKAEAFDGAENLSNAYGYYIDQFAWALTADLFARDGWKELSYIGTFIGKDRVRQSMIQRYGDNGANPAFQAIHQKTQPYVTVLDDGARAMVRTRLWQFNSSSTAQGSWIAGIYENQVKKEDGIWRIHGMDLDYTWLADYDKGWTGIVPGASERFAPTPEQVKAFAPDAPLRGETFAPFPRIAPMGFHFANPVSGREPPLRLHWSDGHRGQ